MRPMKSVLATPLALLALVTGPTPSAATPHQAHLHYMIGVRAYAGSKNAAMLHHEAIAPGLDLSLSLVNAREMGRLAAEIAPWVERIAKESGDEATLIADELSIMRTRAASAKARSEELESWIAPLVGQAATPLLAADDELQRRVVSRAGELFYDFTMILRQHKSAETRLGIPIPPDPPIPSGGSTPAKE
ncbi:MAG: hypothetical protein IT349_19690 [Candidatus Eisenbacteria bacterium]|nr:hypothetical protein [Candidatus Eisenbacteria bacterium]MCC7144325.1 hypothetical protein [Candidatus Eisenbacteria bacterium]